MPEAQEKLTYSADEAARRLGISKNLVYKLVHNGELPAIRLGWRLLLPVSRVNALLNGKAELNGKTE